MSESAERRPANSLKANVVANLAGNGWVAVLQLVCLPVYVHLLGVEAYGLIGFFAALQTLVRVLDFGLGHTINREMARYSVQGDAFVGEARDFLRTFAVTYGVVGLVIGISLAGLAPLLGTRFIAAKSLTGGTIAESIALMAIVIALQWPSSAYIGALLGMQRHWIVNWIKVVFSTLGNVGAIGFLWFFSPSITLFFLVQAAVSAAALIVTAAYAWRAVATVERGHRARFRFALLRRHWRFAAGVTGLTITGLIMTQADKWILVSLVDLESFGYYSLAATVAASLYLVVTPLFNAFFPRFSALTQSGHEDELARQYHVTSQLMACLLFPLGLVLMLFAPEVLLLWTRSSDVAERAATVVTLLAIGNVINGVMHLPYSLQLAAGWTSLGLRINIALLFVFVPLVYYCISRYGLAGAGIAWVTVCVLYLASGVPLTHRRLLTEEQARWWVRDILAPLICVTAVLAPARVVLGLTGGRMAFLFELISLTALATVLAIISCGNLRGWALAELRARVDRSRKYRVPSGG